MGKIKIGVSDAFTVIDGQRDFANPHGALYVAGVNGEESNYRVIENILGLAALPFGYRATTEDKHPIDHIESTIFPEHCLAGTIGQIYIPQLQSLYSNCDENIMKGGNQDVIAYSVVTTRGFADHVSRLRRRAIKRTFLVGWAYTHCVGESAIAYATQGFETYVVRDATRSVPPPYGDPDAMKQKLQLYGVSEITMADINR